MPRTSRTRWRGGGRGLLVAEATAVATAGAAQPTVLVEDYVTFPRFPSAIRSRTIGYIWDTTAPVGAVFPSQKVGTVTFVVVRSDEPVGANSQNTKSRAESFIGEILFRGP